MSRSRNPYNRRAANAGVGLIEVLIAVLVMAIGLLGIAALQATALRNSQSSLERSQAVIQSYAILDAMRANAIQARAGQYNASSCAVAGAADGLAKANLDHWAVSISTVLGDTASGAVCCQPVAGGVASDCTVTVKWNDTRGTGGDSAQEIKTMTRV